MAELDPAQRFMLAMPAILNERNGDRHDLLGGSVRTVSSGRAAYILASGWGIRTPRQTLDALQWLEASGHREGYARQSGASAESFLGWDVCRAANVAGWSYVAYLLDRETAWGFLKRAALSAQSTFGSFAELGQSFLAGLRIWSGNPNDKRVQDSESALASLCSRADSPFADLPWKTALADTPPPLDDPREVHVSEGESIQKAIEQAGAGGRVVLGKGLYREGVQPAHGIELFAAGDGEVVIEGDGKPALWAANRIGIAARGISLRGTRTADQKTLNAISVVGGWVRLESCDVSATHHGLSIRFDGDAFLERTKLHDIGKSGIEVNPGSVVMLDSEIRRTGLHGISRIAGIQAVAVLEGSHIADVAQAGVFAKDEVSILDSHIESPGQFGIVVQGKVTVRKSSIRASKGWGIAVQEEGILTLVDSEIEGSHGANLDVAKGRARVTGGAIRGGASSGIVLQGEARAGLVNVAIEENAQGNVFAIDGARAVFLHCKIRGGASGMWLRKNSVRVIGTTIDSVTGNGIEIVGPTDAIVCDCDVRGSGGVGIKLGEGASASMSSLRVTGSTDAGLAFGADATTILEDVTTTDNGSLNRFESASNKVVNGGGRDVDLPAVEGEEDHFVFRLRDDAALEHAFAHRAAPPQLPLLAQAIVNACASEIAGHEGIEFELEKGSFIARATTRELVDGVRAVVANLAREPTKLRTAVDRISAEHALDELLDENA